MHMCIRSYKCGVLPYATKNSRITSCQMGYVQQRLRHTCGPRLSCCIGEGALLAAFGTTNKKRAGRRHGPISLEPTTLGTTAPLTLQTALNSWGANIRGKPSAPVVKTMQDCLCISTLCSPKPRPCCPHRPACACTGGKAKILEMLHTHSRETHPVKHPHLIALRLSPPPLCLSLSLTPFPISLPHMYTLCAQRHDQWHGGYEAAAFQRSRQHDMTWRDVT
jgi:hypothetical protein